MEKTFTPITSGGADSLTDTKSLHDGVMAQLILIYFLLVPEVCSSFGSKCLSSALNCMIAKSQLYDKKITMDPIWLMDGFLFFFCLSVHKDQASSTTTHPLDSQAALKSKPKASSPKLDPKKTPLFHRH